MLTVELSCQRCGTFCYVCARLSLRTCFLDVNCELADVFFSLDLGSTFHCIVSILLSATELIEVEAEASKSLVEV